MHNLSHIPCTYADKETFDIEELSFVRGRGAKRRYTYLSNEATSRKWSRLFPSL